MRILQVSDLHLEFEDFRPTVAADILMLNGDICVADYLNKTEASKYSYIGKRCADFFQYCSDNYEHVLYIMGNHEHYTGRFDKTVNILKDKLPEGITILDDSYVDIGDTRFIGSTLWTNVNNYNPISIEYIKNGMSDYKIIKYFDGANYRKLTPNDTISMHDHSVRVIDILSQDHDKVVVMSHHAPTELSVHPKYHNDTHMNGGYYSNLTNLILDRPQIKLWSHGHMHDCFDYMMGDTRIVCNPKGYYNENKFFKPDRIIEL